MTRSEFAPAEAALRADEGLRHPRLREAAALLNSGRYPAARQILDEYLMTERNSVRALRLLAEIATREARNADAERLLAEALQFEPDSVAIRYTYGQALLRTKRFARVLQIAEELRKEEPANPLFQALRALALEELGNNAGAGAAWEEILAHHPAEPDCWLRYGHVLRAAGAQERCIEAYRKAIELDAGFGRVYWALANLKTYEFSDPDISQMEQQLGRDDLATEERIPILFSLGRAYGHRQDYQKSFSHYARANALQRLQVHHDPELLTRYVARCKALFTPEFFAARAGKGCESRAPIFLVGMMRSGSTLVEQILASHSRIEGTRELFVLSQLAKDVEAEAGAPSQLLPEILQRPDAKTPGRWGERYLEAVAVHRRQKERPFFLDKMGTNFVHVGMLRLMLPKAKIVDVRRHPLACGFSNFAEYFISSQNFACRLSDLGRLYRDYVELMAHFDHVLPGKVHRVFYEQLIEDPEREVRRLLDYVGLPFETQCLDFHKTDRVVTTASSEQVRQPIYRHALEHWRAYERWLGPLKAALGPVLDAYPEAPEFS